MDSYKKEGPLLKNRREQPKLTHGQMIKGVGMILGNIVFPQVEMPVKRRPRGKDKGPRNFVEARLRKEVTKWLVKNGWRYWRIENSIGGKSTGLPDLLIAKDKMIFIELKGTGGLTGLQPEFQHWCLKCGMPYYVVRSVEQLINLL